MFSCIVDAQMIQDSEGFKMDLLGGLERTLGDKIKPSTHYIIFLLCYTPTDQ